MSVYCLSFRVSALVSLVAARAGPSSPPSLKLLRSRSRSRSCGYRVLRLVVRGWGIRARLARLCATTYRHTKWFVPVRPVSPTPKQDMVSLYAQIGGGGRQLLLCAYLSPTHQPRPSPAGAPSISIRCSGVLGEACPPATRNRHSLPHRHSRRRGVRVPSWPLFLVARGPRSGFSLPRAAASIQQ